MTSSTRRSTRVARLTLTLIFIASCVVIAVAQTGDRVGQLQEITQLIARLKAATDTPLYPTLYKELEQKELAFLSPTTTDRALYADFLRQPEMGIIRLMPRENFDGVLYSRGGGAYYSFARRTHLYDYGSDLSLERDFFKVGFAGADFGFLISLGDVALETVTAETPAVEYLAKYVAPTTEPEARVEQQRTGQGFQTGSFAYRNRFAAVVGNTYAVRSVGYHDSDSLIVFRALRKDTDGSLILLWKRLKWFATPQLNGGSIAVVSSASYRRGVVAPESIATAFIPNVSNTTTVADRLPLPTTLAGVSVTVWINASDAISLCCSAGAAARIFAVSPNQINFEIPHKVVASYYAIITVRKADGTSLSEHVRYEPVAPALFTANANGQGVPAAVLLRVQNGVQTYEPIARFDSAQSKYVSLPIDVSSAGGQAYLVLFGTGIRWRQDLSAVNARVGDVDLPLVFAGEQGAPGLDQLNLALPSALAGRGEVDLVVTVDGQTANTVRINLK